MTTVLEGLSPGLWREVRDAWVAEDCLTAGIVDAVVHGETPGECKGLFASMLYEILHSGFRTDDGPQLKRLRNRATESALATAVPHTTTPYPLHMVGDEGDEWVVQIDGVRVRVPAPQSTESVLRLPAARPALSPGFYLLDGSQGRPSKAPLLRLYAGLTGLSDALRTWRTALTHLEGARIPYRAKVLSTPQLYPRRDALVIYLGPEAWDTLPSLVQALNRVHVRASAVSPFVRELAPGIGVAFEPTDPRAAQAGLSFGQHRAGAVAEGLMAAPAADEDARAESITAAFHAAHIDPRAPWRNLHSPDIAL